MANEPIIDVQQLVTDLRARARQGDGELAFGALEIPAADGRPVVRFRPELGYSSKPVVGKAITGVKRTILRMVFHVFDALARDTDHAIHALWNRTAEVERIAQADRGHIDAAIENETSAREQVQADVASIAQRLASVEEQLRQLQIAPRLARLERAARSAPAAPSAPAGTTSAAPAAPAADTSGPRSSGFDYERFEDRFRPRDQVDAHQRQYVELLVDAERVLDIGCGRGELVAMLRERGVDAYGYEIEPDFVGLAEEAGLPVTLGDGIAHLAGVEPGTLGGVVSSHVVEHLEPTQVLTLVNAAGAALRPGGVLILETPNPESLVAGSVNFHRDLTHRRPIHPDTLAFLCESAGFDRVEVRRLSPVDDATMLPDPDDGTALSETIKRLNALLYGYQDYAVIARLP
ncbi:MAG: class I SAM-dependent methyltransferase [Actinobacteria bacterium]|nr:class I SAM-dependent methyltransferase [Actinomycetota bacterium]